MQHIDLLQDALLEIDYDTQLAQRIRKYLENIVPLTTGSIRDIKLTADKDTGETKPHFSLRLVADESFYVLKLHKNIRNITVSGLKAKDILVSFNEDKSVAQYICIPIDKDYLLSQNPQSAEETSVDIPSEIKRKR